MPEAEGPLIEVEEPVQLLVEGNDQRNFFETLLCHLGRIDVQVHNFGGVNDLRDFLPGLVDAPGFKETVRSVGIVRDAETSAESALQSIQSSLRKAGLETPDSPGKRISADPSVTVLILPDGKRKGMLETLLCESFAGTPVDECIDGFFECVEAVGESVKRPDKARAWAYLTTMPDPHHSVGVAAKRGYWDLDHDAFGNVRDFLEKLCTVGAS